MSLLDMEISFFILEISPKLKYVRKVSKAIIGHMFCSDPNVDIVESFNFVAMI